MLLVQFLGKAEINHLNVAVQIKHDVFGLEIAVNDALVLQTTLWP